MSKTIKLHGFASAVTIDEVKQFLETYTGEGTVETVKVSHKEGSRSFAKVHKDVAKGQAAGSPPLAGWKISFHKLKY